MRDAEVLQAEKAELLATQHAKAAELERVTAALNGSVSAKGSEGAKAAAEGGGALLSASASSAAAVGSLVDNGGAWSPPVTF